jgi:hypothetical protein
MAADDDKKLVLARRAKFVAAALAGVSVACGKEPAPPPQPCLSVPMDNRDAGAPEPPPQPCLTPMMMPEDAGPPAAATDASAGDASTSGAKDAGTAPPKPTPCLAPPLPTNTAPTKPMPCLTPVRPPDKGTR